MAEAARHYETGLTYTAVLTPGVDGWICAQIAEVPEAISQGRACASDWQTGDKNGNPLERPFLKKSGWRKIARAFNLSFERVDSRVEREEDGTPVRAEVWIRAVAPNGQFGDGDGYCSADEVRFKSWKGRQKLENDLRSTATTRAKNRATADLVAWARYPPKRSHWGASSRTRGTPRRPPPARPPPRN